jgi:hypothetical protein
MSIAIAHSPSTIANANQTHHIPNERSIIGELIFILLLLLFFTE